MKLPLFLAFALTLTLTCASTQYAQAQDYFFAAGVRADYPGSYGITLKYFNTETVAFELIGRYRPASGVRDGSFSYSAFSQIHNPIVSNLKWFYGFGVTTGSYIYEDVLGLSQAQFQVGVAACLGLDFRIPNFPLAFSVDWMPHYYFIELNKGFDANGGGISIRYALGDN
jgi:hypothetical protein